MHNRYHASRVSLRGRRVAPLLLHARLVPVIHRVELLARQIRELVHLKLHIVVGVVESRDLARTVDCGWWDVQLPQSTDRPHTVKPQTLRILTLGRSRTWLRDACIRDILSIFPARARTVERRRQMPGPPATTTLGRLRRSFSCPNSMGLTRFAVGPSAQNKYPHRIVALQNQSWRLTTPPPPPPWNWRASESGSASRGFTSMESTPWS